MNSRFVVATILHEGEARTAVKTGLTARYHPEIFPGTLLEPSTPQSNLRAPSRNHEALYLPHLQLSTALVKTEVVILPFTIPVTLFGLKVKMDVKPKANILIKVDLWQVTDR
jgi:hypothetical protein